MKNEDLYAVLMAGGVGSRFWPRSRRKTPKQLLKIFSEEKMITATSKRLLPMVPYKNQFVVTNEVQAEGVSLALPNIPKSNIIIEPLGRNTAPCIGLAAINIEKINPDAVMVVLPADHLIKDEKKFREILDIAVNYAAQSGDLVTLGIKPTYAETGYGYIQSGDHISTVKDTNIYRVRTFAEKPNYDTAKRFLQSGDFSWNSGMFIWSVQSILQEIEEHLPDLFDGLMEIKQSLSSPEEKSTIEKIYKMLKKVSIDYGIMERSQKVATIAGDFGWNDLGSWDVVYDLFANKDEDDNAVLPGAEELLLNSRGNLIITDKQKLFTLIDMQNIIVINTEDALLICPRGKSQDVKKIVEQLEKNNQDKYL